MNVVGVLPWRQGNEQGWSCCNLGYMWRTKHPLDYLDFTKEEFSLKHELGYQGEGKLGSETNGLCLINFSKIDVNGIFFSVSTI